MFTAGLVDGRSGHNQIDMGLYAVSLTHGSGIRLDNSRIRLIPPYDRLKIGAITRFLVKARSVLTNTLRD